MRTILFVVAVLLVASSAFAQDALRPVFQSPMTKIGSFNLSGPDSPFGTFISHVLVEVDATHPGPEILVYQRNPDDPTKNMLTLAIHDHPTKHMTMGLASGLGICAEVGVVIGREISHWEVSDLDHDGRSDVVSVWAYWDIDHRVDVYRLDGLKYCR